MNCLFARYATSLQVIEFGFLSFDIAAI